MRHNKPVGCVTTAATNAELGAWLAADPASDPRSVERLFRAVAPLLVAYFDGQLQGRPCDTEALVLETLIELYRQRSGQGTERPFRAWMMDMARMALLRYLEDGRVRAAEWPAGTGGNIAGMDRGTARRLHVLARRCIQVVRPAPPGSSPSAVLLGAFA